MRSRPARALVKTGPKALVTHIPAGKRPPVLPELGQRFFKQQTRIPRKVFDARTDFGAKGDGRADDTSALQSCIDAARRWGHDAVAYLPGGDYRVSRTLTVSGADYFIGGMGVATRLNWTGAGRRRGHGMLMCRNVWCWRTSFSRRRTTRYTRIRHTASGPSSIFYDQIEVNHWNEDPPDGLVCEDLPAQAQVRLGLFSGNLRLHDCGQADIFAFVHYGPATIEGAERPQVGLHGADVSQCSVVASRRWVVCPDGARQPGSRRRRLLHGAIGPLSVVRGRKASGGRACHAGGFPRSAPRMCQSVIVRDYEGRIWIQRRRCPM